ncbi:hypothetical protein SAMN03159444_05170 [Pseudomonas sp. NFACC02]|nr:hypothetical protein SAMN03159444_05170 [Pseudomonas sp. NFACC02]
MLDLHCPCGSHDFTVYALPVGDVGGYDGSEGGGSAYIRCRGSSRFASQRLPD